MRPITVLNGIIMGSCAAIFLGISVTLIIFLLLSPENPSLQREFALLRIYDALFAGLLLLSALAFIGQLLLKKWRWWAQGALVAGLAGAILYLLP